MDPRCMFTVTACESPLLWNINPTMLSGLDNSVIELSCLKPSEIIFETQILKNCEKHCLPLYQHLRSVSLSIRGYTDENIHGLSEIAWRKFYKESVDQTESRHIQTVTRFRAYLYGASCRTRHSKGQGLILTPASHQRWPLSTDSSLSHTSAGKKRLKEKVTIILSILIFRRRWCDTVLLSTYLFSMLPFIITIY